MSRSKQLGPRKLSPEELALHRAVQAYVQTRGGEAWIVGPAHIEPHKQPTSFDVIVKVVGKPPKTEIDKHG